MKRNVIIAMSVIIIALVAFIIIKKRKKMKYFSIKELCRSEDAEKHGIDNTPSEEAKINMENLIVEVLDPCREKYGKPITVNSGYRSRQLNAKVGGVDTSDHLTGEAADITGGSVAENRRIFKTLVENGKFDQIIWEKGGQWVHVSWRGDDSRHIMLEFKNNSYRRIDENWEEVINKN